MFKPSNCFFGCDVNHILQASQYMTRQSILSQSCRDGARPGLTTALQGESLLNVLKTRDTSNTQSFLFPFYYFILLFYCLNSLGLICRSVHTHAGPSLMLFLRSNTMLDNTGYQIHLSWEDEALSLHLFLSLQYPFIKVSVIYISTLSSHVSAY